MRIEGERAFVSRLLYIHEQLVAGGRINSIQLSRQYEVSSRTIQRDIDYMRDELELPIEYDMKKKSFYYADFPGMFAKMETLREFAERANRA